MGRIPFLVLCLISWHPDVSGSTALVLGLCLSLAIGNTELEFSRKYALSTMEIAIILLGAGMDLRRVVHIGSSNSLFTASVIAAVLGIGFCLGLFMNLRRKLATLISSGVAICGASAIAVVSIAIGSEPFEVSIALVALFLLNACAMLVLPYWAHFVHFTDQQFGLWSAFAVLDTSAVASAAMSFGGNALEYATAAKLARAVWIVPVALGAGLFYRRQNKAQDTSRKKPWFIALFLVMAGLFTFVPQIHPFGKSISWLGQRCLVFSLFLTGSSLTREQFKQLDGRVLGAAVLLWLLVMGVSFFAIKHGWLAH